MSKSDLSSDQLSLDLEVDKLYLIGPKLAKSLTKIGVAKLRDLIFLIPSRYQDRQPLNRVIKPDDINRSVTVLTKIIKASGRLSRRGLSVQQFEVVGYNNQTLRVTFFNQPYLLISLKPGQQVCFWGQVKADFNGFNLLAQGYEVIKAGQPSLHCLRLVPIYPETKGLSNKRIRRLIYFYLDKLGSKINEYLPDFILKQEGYPKIPLALQYLHRPVSLGQAAKAKERFLFEKLFTYQLIGLIKKKNWQTKTSLVRLDQSTADNLITKLQTSSSLTLSPSQKHCLNQIIKDMLSTKPMNRLLLGDVGAGKTLVGAGAAYAVHLTGWRTLVMTPTEILAEQTYAKFKSYLPDKIRIKLHTQSHKTPTDKWDVLIGTQALLWRRRPKQTGLVIIDEQHRFGVRQRAKLTEYNPSPHVLTMTATPIPRTIALTLFGHLDISYLEPLPNKIKQTKTYIIKPDQVNRTYRFIIDQVIENQSRAFIVTPLIETSSHESLKDIKAATSLYDQLRQTFTDFNGFGLLHGRIKPKEKDKIMTDFRLGKIKILITTSVIEVGVDVPQADIILIQGAERFGLAQLHQLRGRVGRMGQTSYCFLAPTKLSQSVYNRLKLLKTINSGHKLAEADMKLRGPGQVFGLAQHGFAKDIFPLLEDVKLIEKANLYANQVINHLSSYPDLPEQIKQVKIKDISFT